MTETAPRPRRARSVTESLLSIVLGLEAILVFFLTMTAFGLKVVEPVVAFGGGAVLVVLLLVGGRVLRYPWGVWVGWALQAVLVATGLVMPLMFLIAAVFVSLWTYCLIKGTQLDRPASSGAASSQQPASSPTKEPS